MNPAILANMSYVRTTRNSTLFLKLATWKLEEKRFKWEYACGMLVVKYEKLPVMLEYEKK